MLEDISTTEPQKIKKYGEMGKKYIQKKLNKIHKNLDSSSSI
jgi:hypothetical protein